MPVRRLLLDLAYLGRRTPLRPLLRGVREQMDRGLLALGLPPVRASCDGVPLRGFLRHRDFLDEAAHGYEDTSRRLLREALVPGVTVVDGGAHIGVFAVGAASRIGARGRVFAVEADPYNYAALAINKRRNRLENLDAVHAALDEAAGKRTFHVSRGTISSSLIDRGFDRDTRPVHVRATTVDALLSGVELRRLVIKLDVEGAEDRVLRGASRCLAAAESCRLIVEHNSEALRQAHVPTDAVLRHLTGLGFVVSIVDERTGATTPASAPALEGLKANLVADKNID